MFCGECGHRWAPEEIASARFCAECGAPREDPVPVPAPVPAPVAAPPPPAVSPPPAPTTNSHVYGSPLMRTTLTTDSTKAAPSFSLDSAPSAACAVCRTPFGESVAQFCGECGTPRPASAMPVAPQPAAAQLDDDDGDLFGAASTTFTASAPSPAPMVPSAAPTLGQVATLPSTSVSFMPPNVAPLEPTPTPMPAAAPAPLERADSVSPPATITLNTSSAMNQVSTLLANLSVSASNVSNSLEREEPDGTGAGINVRRVVQTRDMDSLTTRLMISQAVESNRKSSPERVENYNITKVNETITLVHNARVEEFAEERYYNERTVPDNNDWQQILRQHRQQGTQFTDPQFPPDSTSLFRDVNNKRNPHLEDAVWKWKRISDFFNETAYVEITMLDDDKKLVCSIAMKSPAEAESILSILRQDAPARPIEPDFFRIAKEAVSTGLSKRRRDHLLLCTKNMIMYLSDYVQDGLQRFDLLWEKSLMERYRPLSFAGVGDGHGYRVDASDAGLVSRVSVLVPVNFRAQGTCVFDRSQQYPHRQSNATGPPRVGIEPGELRPTRLDYAYLFGALSVLSTSPHSLAQVFPLLDSDLVRPDRVEVATLYPNEQQYNEEGVYAVRFWRNHRSRIVVIDDFIPCNPHGKPVFGSFTGSQGKFEIWSLLVEKAYAKLHGGYEAIMGGQDAHALQDLYGNVSFQFTLSEKCPSELEAWERLTSALQNGSLLGCRNDRNDSQLPRGLRLSATYGIRRFVEVDVRGSSVRLVQLRNSWGIGTLQNSEKWTGSWSNTDPQWHGFSRAQKVACGFQFREDHTYWMEFSAFMAFFPTILESRNLYNYGALPDETGSPVAASSQSVHIITSEWSGLTCGGCEAMHLNPQYHLVPQSLASSGHLTAQLEQPSRRMKNELEYSTYIAPVVFRHTGEPGERKIDLSSQDVVARGTFISTRSTLLEAKLEPGTDIAATPKAFVVIPSTYDARVPQPLGFTLALFTTHRTSIVPVSDMASLPICCVCSNALSGSFRTFTLIQGDGTEGSPKRAQVDRVCNGCIDTYRQRHTPTCAHCNERVEAVPGKFSGRIFSLPDGATVHAECIDAYRIRIADKCIECGAAIAAVPGRFDGTFFDIPSAGGKVHAECMEAYQLRTAKRCRHCSEAVAKVPGCFDGRFYKLPESEDVVHFECWDAYQAAMAPKCVHCSEPVMVVPGRFDGRFYDLTSGGGKVHFECWDAYQAAVLRR
ncbi:hypothetical protein PINS_up015258 [Pythium insidiosum]|nr:hypothetical protein PINS_up015258 [Pythium insidiosum]